eukprot:2038968-Rhodomonas_salina.2
MVWRAGGSSESSVIKSSLGVSDLRELEGKKLPAVLLLLPLPSSPSPLPRSFSSASFSLSSPSPSSSLRRCLAIRAAGIRRAGGFDGAGRGVQGAAAAAGEGRAC